MKIHIVLFEPEIPQNTGNIARTCVGFNATLHLIRPYGFVLSDKNLKRSGCDYWNHLKLIEHDCYDDFIKTLKPNDQIYYITRYGKHLPHQIKKPSKNGNLYLMFGKESTGITKSILVKNKSHTIRIPSSKNVRSLNLSNCVALLIYQAAQLNNFEGLEIQEPHKIHYLDK